MTAGPRVDLAAALAEAGGPTLTCLSEMPAQAPALPALVVRPGAPYRTESLVPYCREHWGLEIVALVPIDAVLPLDDLDALITLCRDVIRGIPTAAYNGVREAPAQQSIGGQSMRGAIVQLELDT